MGNAAIQVDFLMAGIIDSNGLPLTGGKVDTFEAGTTTPKQTFVESDKSVVEENPIILDALGRKLVFADGNYKFVIKTSDDVVLSTFDNLEYGIVSVILPKVSAPPGIADKGQLTGLPDGDRTELRYTDDLGGDTQLTKGGKINAIAGPGLVIDRRIVTFQGTDGLDVQDVPVTINANGTIIDSGISAELVLRETGFPNATVGSGKYSVKELVSVGSNIIEAMYTDGLGNNVQLTEDGAVKVPPQIGLGDWDARAVGIIFTETTDGFVIAYRDTGPTGNISMITDSNSKTETTDQTEAFKLHDADGGFVAGHVGVVVLNTTDTTQTTVTAFVDSGELTLADDIFVSGEDYSLPTPTTVRIESFIDGDNPRFNGTMPVKKGDFWQVTGAIEVLLFIPLG